MKATLKRAYRLYSDLSDLRRNMEKSNDVLLSTMNLSTFDAFLKKYLDIISEIFVSLKDENSAKANAISNLIQAEISKTRKLLVANLSRIFYAHDNTAFSAATTDELDLVTKSAEEGFDSEVKKAIDYFGESFMKARVVYGTGVFTFFLPKTVEDMLSSQKRYQWQSHTIVNGFPQPLHLDLYREALPIIIEDWIKEKENTVQQETK